MQEVGRAGRTAALACRRSDSAEARPPATNAPSPSRSESRRVMPSQLRCAAIALLSASRGQLLPSTLEEELRGVEKRPEEILGRRPPGMRREPLQGSGPLRFPRPSTIHGKIDLFHHFLGT